jgi:hypothetical protein|tara:strand:+ start:56 stop:247 length:192 start_codon:yes stop_codon:yes gene_type:complete
MKRWDYHRMTKRRVNEQPSVIEEAEAYIKQAKRYTDKIEKARKAKPRFPETLEEIGSRYPKSQ